MLVRLDGSPWEACPHVFLKQAIAAVATAGYSVLAAFEPEFTLDTREGDRLLPLCYSATGFHTAHEYAMDPLHALTGQGMEVEHYYSELRHASRR